VFSLSNLHHENVSRYILFINESHKTFNPSTKWFEQYSQSLQAEPGRKWKLSQQTNPLKYFKRNYIKFPSSFRPVWNHLTTARHVRNTRTTERKLPFAHVLKYPLWDINLFKNLKLIIPKKYIIFCKYPAKLKKTAAMAAFI